jgi:hypothetical protein
MPAVKRRLLTLSAAASFVLLIAVTALWVRSYRRYDRIQYIHISDVAVRWVGIRSSSGCLEVYSSWLTQEYLGGADVGRPGLKYNSDLVIHAGGPRNPRTPARRDRGSFSSIGGFGYAIDHDSGRGVHRFYWLPLWFVVVVLSVLPAMRMVAAVRARKRRVGRCHRCGYDLRATPDRCPECGAVPVSAVGCVPP